MSKIIEIKSERSSSPFVITGHAFWTNKHNFFPLDFFKVSTWLKKTFLGGLSFVTGFILYKMIVIWLQVNM